jgi:ferredoxin--NADP+ reductase
VTPAELGERYHAVIVATGAVSDRKLGIEGEQLPGVYAASDFVGWYNGHPDYADMRFDLSSEVAVIIGQGNVAIDVCRILAKPVQELRRTDIAEHAIEALAQSRVREIHLIGRRGPVQARFTPKELRELGSLPGWQPVVDGEAFEPNEASRAELADPANANSLKNMEILRCFFARPLSPDRKLALRFLLAPRALHGAGRLQRITFDVQRLVGDPFTQQSEPDGYAVELEAGLLFRSVGYRSTAIAGLPFDARRGVLPNCQGRIVSESGQALVGWYATGWVKRGPTGVIGTNRLDSVETVERLLEDLPTLDRPGRSGRPSLIALLEQRLRRAVGFEGWLRIEALEHQRGAQRNKVAEKLTCITEMLLASTTVPGTASF